MLRLRFLLSDLSPQLSRAAPVSSRLPRAGKALPQYNHNEVDDVEANLNYTRAYQPAQPIVTRSTESSSTQCPCCFGAVHRRGSSISTTFIRSFSIFRMSSSFEAQKGQSVVDIIKADHRHADHLFSQYNRVSDLALKYEIAWKLINLLSQHSAQEEMTIYPYMKEHSGKMVGTVNHSIQEHQTLKEELAKLEKLEITDPRFDTTLQAIMKDVQHHVKEEEESVLPGLESLCTAAELVKLGKDFIGYKNIAPTHPHPHALNTGGIGTVIMNSGLRVVDEINDTVVQAKQQEMKQQMEQERKSRY